MYLNIVLTPIYTTSSLWSTGNTRKYQQIDVYIYQCVNIPIRFLSKCMWSCFQWHFAWILAIVVDARREMLLWICIENNSLISETMVFVYRCAPVYYAYLFQGQTLWVQVLPFEVLSGEGGTAWSRSLKNLHRSSTRNPCGPWREKTCLRCLRTAKAQTSLHFRAVWLAPLLFAYRIASYLNLIQASLKFSSYSL